MRRSLPFLAALALAGAAAGARAQEILLDGIAAQVGTDIVLISEVMQIVAPDERRMRAANLPEAEIAKLRAEGLDTMIEWRIIEKLVRELELHAGDDEVDQTIQMIAEQNGISLEELKRSIDSQDMTFAGYQQEIKRELERRKLVNSLVASRVHVDESDIRKRYQERFAEQPAGGSQYHVLQIVIPAQPELGVSLLKACGVVTELRLRIDGGEPFEELARRHSAVAPGQGGDVGWIHEESMADWLRALVEPLEDGQVSDLAQLPWGCALVKLLETQTYEPISYEQAKGPLHGELFEERVADEYRDWMEELRENTYIERRGYFANAARLSGPPPARPPPEQADAPQP